MKRVIIAPSKYLQGQGQLAALHDETAKLGRKGAFAVVDPFILDHYEKEIKQSFGQGGLPLHIHRFSGECSKAEIKRLTEAMAETGSDVVIGMGGGKSMDTAKAVAHYNDLPVVIVPTAASTDAPCSALSVLYTQTGEFDEYLFLKHNPNLVLMDTALAAAAPTRLLIAGMGDALATYYEARACYRSGSPVIAGGGCSETALAIARTCRDILFADGLLAKLAVESKTVSRAVENVVEANTYLSGVGFESGGLAAAHAVHNGLTTLRDCHAMLHGEKVAFGLITQLVLENAPEEEIWSVIDFCRNIGLPTSLAMLGAKSPSPEQIMAVAEASCAEGETIHNMPFKVRAEDVYSAILVADKLGAREDGDHE